jgi:hypothetical protein
VRLLDHIAQSHEPFVVRQDDGARWQLTGAADFARELEQCPLRYVLDDDLVRTCVALGYSDSEALGGCLDLLHLPAERLWVEWDEAARREALTRELPACAAADDCAIVRGGVLLSAHPQRRAASLRTFWLPRAEPRVPLLAPVETLLDLEGSAASAAAEALLEGHAVAVRDGDRMRLDGLLQCASFRLDPSWLHYYRSVTRDPATRAEVIRGSLAAVVFDVPMLLALLMLLLVPTVVRELPVCRARLNAKRARLGRRPLLEHIEVACRVPTVRALRAIDGRSGTRRAPRLHHVRGHLVRRSNTLYWRGPHWRGHARFGRVRSRTVELHLPG